MILLIFYIFDILFVIFVIWEEMTSGVYIYSDGVIITNLKNT